MMSILMTAALAGVALQPCEIQGRAAECGTLSVPENRAIPRGRSIALHFALVRQAPKARTEDAVFVLVGGPGKAATTEVDFATALLAPAGRDLVFVDVRGTGKSNPLHCELGGNDDDLQGYFNDFLPIERIASCREALASRADLTQYTTRAIADDLEDVRRKLGYRRVNLYGTSYGTRLAQELMRRHPKSIRMAILRAVVSPSFVAPRPYAQDAQRSLEGVFALCAADPACRTTYPALDSDYRSMMGRIADGIELSLQASPAHSPARVKVNRGLTTEIFRNFLYSPEVYASVPRIVHQAAQGDFTDFASTAVAYARTIRTLDFGLFLSVTCTEDIPRLNVAEATRAAQGTLLGAYRIEQQVAACRLWPRGEADPARVTPLRSSIPTLLISGGLDPVTPPKYAAEVARTLSNAVHVVVPNGGHSADTGGCVEHMIVQAIQAGSVRELDQSCIGRLPKPKFSVPQPAEQSAER